jgi:hypothetical protein
MLHDIINTRKMGTQMSKVEATSVITLRISWAVQKANMENEWKINSKILHKKYEDYLTDVNVHGWIIIKLKLNRV